LERIADTSRTSREVSKGPLAEAEVAGSLGRSTVSRRQLIEQSLGLLQVERVEPLGEPCINRAEEIADRIPLALPRQSRVTLVAARSSQDFACC
jgi:hypothetical protein